MKPFWRKPISTDFLIGIIIGEMVMVVVYFICERLI
jgi:hypothetical protein